MQDENDYPVAARAESHRFDTTLESYVSVLEKLALWGVRVNPASRLASYERLLRAAVDRSPREAPQRELERLSFVLLEILEVIDIVQAYRRPPERALQRFAVLAAGGVQPDDERTSPGRDAQYELWLRALLRGKGIPCRIADPDLRFRWRGETVSIEAKRPSSVKSLDDRYRKALQQLDAYPEGGVVAISLDRLLRPRGKVLRAADPRQASQFMDYLFMSQAKELISKSSPLTNRGSGRNAVAFLFTAKLPAFIPQFGAFAVEFRQEMVFSLADPRHKKFLDLRNRISSFLGR